MQTAAMIPEPKPLSGTERRARQSTIETEFAEDQARIQWPPLPDRSADPCLARVESHTRAERAIVHGDWPFVCPYCTEPFETDSGSFPYCGSICAINADVDR